MSEMIRCPSSEAVFAELNEFAISYDAYRRIAESPEQLVPIIQPIMTAIDAGEAVPPWAGIDLLRAAMFFVHRRGHWNAPYGDPEPHFRVLAARIHELSYGQPVARDSFG